MNRVDAVRSEAEHGVLHPALGAGAAGGGAVRRFVLASIVPSMDKTMGVLAVDLPDEHLPKQAFCDMVLEQIHERWEDLLGFLKVTFEVDREMGREIENLQGEQLWAWLEANGKGDPLRELAIRQCACNIILDFYQFMYYVLHATPRGVTTVAFALLRKPLRDSLFFLEWIAADAQGFAAGLKDVARERTPGRIVERYGRKIVEGAFARVEGRLPFGFDLIYGMRFEKDYDLNVNWLSAQALHLVTSMHTWGTESGELNFVHSGAEDQLRYWHSLYFTSMVYLWYAAEIVEVIYADISGGQRHPDAAVLHLRRSIAFVTHGGAEEATGALHELIDQFGADAVTCPACGVATPIDSGFMIEFAWNHAYTCRECGVKHDLRRTTPPGNV